jgi:hypothetical protein
MEISEIHARNLKENARGWMPKGRRNEDESNDNSSCSSG